jgi:hypothetical protein
MEFEETSWDDEEYIEDEDRSLIKKRDIQDDDDDDGDQEPCSVFMVLRHENKTNVTNNWIFTGIKNKQSTK